MLICAWCFCVTVTRVFFFLSAGLILNGVGRIACVGCTSGLVLYHWVEARLMDWVESILLTSVEAIPRVWGFDGPALFGHLRPLSFSEQHVRMLGEAGAGFLERAARVWRPACCQSPDDWEATPPWADPLHDTSDGRPNYMPFAREYLQTDHVTPQFAESLVYDFRHSAVHNSLHDCRAATCYKGWIGLQLNAPRKMKNPMQILMSFAEYLVLY